jgi:hypothetical protein
MKRLLPGAAMAFACAASVAAPAGSGWKVHDTTRPRPPVVTPAAQKLPAPPAPDAAVLFDGSDLSGWTSEQGGPAKWKVEDGAMTVVPRAGGIKTKREFGDAQVHLEWASPAPPRGKGQGRGNSGVFLMGLYEVQILDSYQNETYADGQAASVYGQFPPLVNASRPPGEWQSLDIMFRRPRFNANGKLLRPARVTVVHNGVLVQDSVELLGPTMWLQHLPYKPHPDKLPISLQEHGDPVRFRNIWVRELRETAEPGPSSPRTEPATSLAPEVLRRYVGEYTADARAGEMAVTITMKGGRLQFGIPIRGQALDLLAHSPREFSLRTTDARVVFDLDPGGRPTGLTFSVAGDTAFTARRVK